MLEREYLVRLLRECAGGKDQAARRASISSHMLHEKLEELRAWLKDVRSDDEEGEVARLKALAGAYWPVVANGNESRNPADE